MYDTDKKKFYIFTNDTQTDSPPNAVWYSEIDLTQGANGAVTVKNVEISTGNKAEALDLVPHTNGTDFWVLVYEGAGQIMAFLVDKTTGVQTDPVVSSIGLELPPGAVEVRWGSINHTQDYDTLVLSQTYNNGGGSMMAFMGAIATVDVNRATGEVSEAMIVATDAYGYHATFSEYGSKVYYTNSQGYIQYDLNTSAETCLGPIVGVSHAAASKLALDGKLYWAGALNSALHIVHSPDEAGADADFEANGLSLEGCLVGHGVPNQTAAFLDYLPPIE